GSCANESSFIRTWTVTDACGNDNTQTQTINIEDTTAPTFTVPAAVTLECDQDITDLTVTGDVTDEADNCGNAALEATYSDGASTAGACANASSFIRTWTVTDACGNTTTQEQTINIEDTTAPTYTVPTEVTLECDQDITDLTVTGDVTDEADNCGNAVLEATYSDGTSTAGSCANESSFIRTWTVTDACGNTTTQEQTINIEDTTAPTYTVPTEVTLECDEDVNDLTLTGDVTDEADNCDTNTLEATYTDGTMTVGSCANASSFIRTWTVTDACGNDNTQTQTINIEDTTAPTFTVPAAVTLECDQDVNDLTVTGDVTDEADNCGNASLEATYTDGASTAGSCANASSFIRTWTVTDACGNTTTQEQIINIEDTTAPTFTVPAAVTLECDQDISDLTVTGDVSDEADNCDTNTLEATYTDGASTAGSCANASSFIRTWTLTDACGNTTTQEQIINIEDTTAPNLVTDLETSITVICSDIPGVPSLEFTDNCSTNTIDVTFNETNSFNGDGNDYIIVREWTATDDCGNTSIFIQEINIISENFINVITEELCTGDGDINLFDFLEDGTDLSSTWIAQDSDVIVDNSGVFDPSTLALEEYIFTYTLSNNGCLDTSEVRIRLNDDCIVLPCGNGEGLSISKAVTPNGDRYNQFFSIEGTKECNFIVDVKIFNRYGAIIFEANDYQNDWSAISPDSSIGNNGQLPNGTYYYVVTLRDSGLKPITGPFYIGTK
ncbi:gliding motility-associated C-terminal domain-containing protein, partial [Bizionia saleffrena]